MADEDKEKAEKLAAAKKRFEQLKKEQQKKGKKTGKKKDDDKTTTAKPDEAAEEATAETEATTSDAIDTDEPAPASIPQQSKQRSESFKQSWTARIEELEKENKSLHEQAEDADAKLAQAEEERDSLRESSGDLAELRAKAKDADRLGTELAAAQRQLAQAQQAAKGGRPRSGTASSPDFSEQLASKTAAVESLELELSNLRNDVTTLQSTITTHEAAAKDLEDRASTAESATSAVQAELDALKVSISFPSESSEDPEALTKRITLLESDLRTANSNLSSAATRATSLEQKIDALTKLHREATSQSQVKDKELTDLRSQLKRRDRASHVRDASEFELGEEETETGALQARIRALEAENFDLRRGVWRDKRAELQPGMNDDGHPPPQYEDVDLNSGPYSPLHSGREGILSRNHSTFQDVITSGISAFTGRPREPPPKGAQGRDRAASLGLMSEDGFDEEAYRLAQEEEAKRRVERVKEVKRGLVQWKGWRVDIVDLRRTSIPSGGRECGPVFEV